uniref:Uncharacterized protein n=1 Tax=Anopheles farauti TaxID=69004 RepID=A0A182Q2B7_9DIPT
MVMVNLQPAVVQTLDVALWRLHIPPSTMGSFAVLRSYAEIVGILLLTVIHAGTFGWKLDNRNILYTNQDISYECPINTMCRCASLPNETALLEINCNEVSLYKFPAVQTPKTITNNNLPYIKSMYINKIHRQHQRHHIYTMGGTENRLNDGEVWMEVQFAIRSDERGLLLRSPRRLYAFHDWG